MGHEAWYMGIGDFAYEPDGSLSTKARAGQAKTMFGLEATYSSAGLWFVEDLLECCLNDAGFKGMRPHYAGRDAAASPATGLAKRHAAEQAALIAGALGHSSRAGSPAAAAPVKDHHGD